MAGEISRTNGAKGGRPKGEANRLSRRRINEIHSLGETPVDVMLDNMLFWHRKVQMLMPKIEHAVVQLEDSEGLAELNGLIRTMLAARENSQKCAVDMAPFCHPRLQAIAIQTQNTHRLVVEGGLPKMPNEGETFEQVIKKKVAEEKAREPA